MIDDNTKLILVENPKSASAALKQMLTGNVFHDSSDPRTASMNHQLPSEIKRRYPDKWRDYNSFVVVRNSWDRTLSFFTYHGVLFQEPSLQGYDFDSWVAAGLPQATEEHVQIHYPEKNGGNHYLSQIEYTEEVDKVICLHSFDPLIRARELERAVTALSLEWGFPVHPVEKHINASRIGPEMMSWTEENVAIIGELFADEITRFGFQPPNVDSAQ
jgi:hypothetical protein